MRKQREKFLAREPQVVAGVELLPLLYRLQGGVEELRLENRAAPARMRAVLAAVTGRARTLLECERVALNFPCSVWAESPL
jgi:nicotinate-nucleotide pyrophosphorylase (carboxylating)